MSDHVQFVNLTPHVVRLNSGREFPPCGQVARVKSEYTEPDASTGIIMSVKFGSVADLPPPRDGTYYIVSALVAQAAGRSDVVSPATGHPACVRKDGQVWSVPGFVRA